MYATQLMRIFEGFPRSCQWQTYDFRRNCLVSRSRNYASGQIWNELQPPQKRITKMAGMAYWPNSGQNILKKMISRNFGHQWRGTIQNPSCTWYELHVAPKLHGRNVPANDRSKTILDL